MTNKLLLLLAAVLCGHLQLLHAQYDRNENKIWIFGARSGIDFNGATPVAFTSGIGTINGGSSASQEGCATIADASGRFLFHTEGTKVWDATDALMPNGANILGFNGTIATPTYSTSQAAVICPVPDSAGQYFIFSLTDYNNAPANSYKLFCNKVKMDLNNGLGDIDTTFPLRHKVVDSLVTERMTIVAGSCFKWLLVYTRDTNSFKAYQITNEGVNPDPVISYVGNFPKISPTVYHYRTGTVKASPDGKLLVNALFKTNNGAGAGLELYDFDHETGIVSNARILDSLVSYCAADFSPDNSKLYATQNVLNAQVYQFDLSHPDRDSIRNSKFPLGPCGLNTDIRLAPNGKLYFARNRGGYTQGNRVLASIENPNAKGALAGYKDTAILLDALTGIMIGLPNVAIVQNRDTGITTAVVLDSSICKFSEPLILSIPAASTHIVWSDGSESDSLAVQQSGTYYVYYRNQNNCAFSDTFKISITDLPEWFITIDKMVLSCSRTFDTYQWYKEGREIPGATQNSIEVDANALYSLKVTFGECEDSASHRVTNYSSIQGTHGTDGRLLVYPNPVVDKLWIEAAFPVSVSLFDLTGKELLRLENITRSIDLSNIKEGIYFIRIQNTDKSLFYAGTLLKK